MRKWKSNLQEEGGHFLWGPKMCSLGLLAAFRVQIADSIRIEITFVANGLTGPTAEEPYCVGPHKKRGQRAQALQKTQK